MLELCRTALARQDPTLREVLLKFPYLFQLQQHLPSHHFDNILPSIQLHQLSRKEAMGLETDCLYFFLEAGILTRREYPITKSQPVKGKQKSLFSIIQRISQQPQAKEELLLQVKDWDSFQSQPSSNKFALNVYTCGSAKPTIVLFIRLQSLLPTVAMAIRDLSTKKARLLARVKDLCDVERATLLQRLHQFQYFEVGFGQFLYSERVRTEMGFVLKSGSVEVVSRRQGTASLVVGSRTMLGLNRHSDEYARCASEKVSCYIIPIQQLTLLLPQLPDPSTSPASGIRTSTAGTAQVLAVVEQNREAGPLGECDKGEGGGFRVRGVLAKRKWVHKSSQNLEVRSISEKMARRMVLKQHFSNYYNQVFEEFSERKIRYMGLKMNTQQDLKMYQVRVVERKVPAMEQIQLKLKKARIDKMKACRDRLKKTEHEADLVGLGISIIEEDPR